MNRGATDKVFVSIVLILVLGGFFIFMSASLGILAREGITLSSITFSQIFFGIVLGSVAAFVASKINFKIWNQYAFYLFVIALILTAAVFIPGIGFAHGGAQRWIGIGPFSFQPSEFLKLASIIYLAAWFAALKKKVATFKYGVLPLAGILFIVALLLLLQPDTDTFLVIALSAFAMYFVAGARWSHILGIMLVGAIAITSLALVRPYIRERLITFINPASDPQGAGYQVQQSLIAIGSGGITGRGYGQSIQKFKFLPEPIGDSIFAVFAEEWGFIGCVVLIALFLALAFRGMRISARAPNAFSRLLVVGLVTMITAQAFINIASMLGVFPLSGLPLTFVSHGGTALLFALLSVGMILNVSRYEKKPLRAS